MSGSKTGRIVHPVSHHRNFLPLFNEFVNQSHFIIGMEARVDLMNTQLLCDRSRRSSIVAREHHGRNTPPMNALHYRLALEANFIL